MRLSRATLEFKVKVFLFYYIQRIQQSSNLVDHFFYQQELVAFMSKPIALYQIQIFLGQKFLLEKCLLS